MRPVNQSNQKGTSNQNESQIVSTSPSNGKSKDSKYLAVTVHFLDDSVTIFKIQAKALGTYLFAQVCEALNLTEVDYFGLEYYDTNGTGYWVDPQKSINRQLSLDLNNPNMYLRVKFYTLDPNTLEDELTWYLFSLQLKKDLISGMLLCDEITASIMASYIVQAEIGDYNLEQYDGTNYISKFKLIPHQSPTFESQVMENHKRLIGQSPAEADFNLFETARRCEYYGIKMTAAKDSEGRPVSLAVNHAGISVFKNLIKSYLYSWTKIRKLSFKRKRFFIKLHEEDRSSPPVVEFLFTSRNECKNFWKKCVEQHTFFRCSEAKNIPRAKKKIFTRGSSFRYSGRTLQQLAEKARQHATKRSSMDRSNSLRTPKKEVDSEKSMQEPSSISTNTSANEANITNITQPLTLSSPPPPPSYHSEQYNKQPSMPNQPKSVIIPASFKSPIKISRKSSFQFPMPPDILCDTYHARKRRNTIEGNIDSAVIMIDILNNQPDSSNSLIDKTATGVEEIKHAAEIKTQPTFEQKAKLDSKNTTNIQSNEYKPEHEHKRQSESKQENKYENASEVLDKNRPQSTPESKTTKTVVEVANKVKRAERNSHSAERASRSDTKPAVPQKPEKLVKEVREARKTPDHHVKPQIAEHTRRSSQKKGNRSKERRAISAPRSRCDMNHLYEHRMSNSKPNRILFAHIKPLNNSSKNIKQVHCVSVHSLPGLESYSYRDDTLDDPLDELLNRRLQNMFTSDSISAKSTSVDELAGNGSGTIKSSKSSLRNHEEDMSCESLDQWASDSQDFESDFGSVDISTKQGDTSDQVNFLHKTIIDSYLTAHFPDDLDIAGPLMINEERKPSDTSSETDCAPLLTIDHLVMQTNLKYFVCY